MATQDFKRKLTAILSADAKGYSRLMGEDEEATVRTITAHRKVMTSVIHLRIISVTGRPRLSSRPYPRSQTFLSSPATRLSHTRARR